MILQIHVEGQPTIPCSAHVLTVAADALCAGTTHCHVSVDDRLTARFGEHRYAGKHCCPVALLYSRLRLIWLCIGASQHMGSPLPTWPCLVALLLAIASVSLAPAVAASLCQCSTNLLLCMQTGTVPLGGSPPQILAAAAASTPVKSMERWSQVRLARRPL